MVPTSAPVNAFYVGNISFSLQHFWEQNEPLYISYGNLTIFTARNKWTFPHIKSAMFCDSVIHMKGLKSYKLLYPEAGLKDQHEINKVYF